jgi:hypothetical protein
MTDIVRDSIKEYFPVDANNNYNVDVIINFFISLRDDARAAGMIENTGIFSFDYDNVELHFKRAMTEDEMDEMDESEERAEYKRLKAKFEGVK